MKGDRILARGNHYVLLQEDYTMQPPRNKRHAAVRFSLAIRRVKNGQLVFRFDTRGPADKCFEKLEALHEGPTIRVGLAA